MSHVARVDIAVTDLECLKLAAEECGLVFNEGQTNYKWYGNWVDDYHDEDAAYHHGINPKDYGKCSHALTVPGNTSAYEVGVVENPNGDGYLLIWDFFGGGHGLQQHIGGPKDCNKLMDTYSKHVVIKQATEQGLSYTEEYDPEEEETTITLWDYS